MEKKYFATDMGQCSRAEIMGRLFKELDGARQDADRQGWVPLQMPGSALQASIRQVD